MAGIYQSEPLHDPEDLSKSVFHALIHQAVRGFTAGDVAVDIIAEGQKVTRLFLSDTEAVQLIAMLAKAVYAGRNT